MRYSLCAGEDRRSAWVWRFMLMLTGAFGLFLGWGCDRLFPVEAAADDVFLYDDRGRRLLPLEPRSVTTHSGQVMYPSAPMARVWFAEEDW